MTAAKDPSVFKPLDPDRRAGPRWRLGRWAAAGLGIAAVGLALAVAELLAQIGNWLGVFHLTASPFSALGATFIYFTPEWLKEFGIRLFGQSDKVALGVSMTGTLLMLGALIGLVGRRRPRWAVGIAIVLIVITGIAVLTRPHASVVDLIPTIVGGLVGIWFLVTALRIALLDPRTGVGPADEATEVGKVEVGTADLGSAEVGKADLGPAGGRATKPGIAVPSGSADRSRTPDPSRTPDRSRTGPSVSSGAGSASASLVDRRRFFRFAGLGALAAGAAALLSRWVPSTAEVEANRASVVLPTVTDSQAPLVTGSSAASATGTTAAPSTSPAVTSGVSASPSTTAAGSSAVNGQAAPVDVDPAVPGITPYVTSSDDFYRVDTAFTVPRVTTDAWRLKIHGLVDEPFEIGYADLLALPQIERMVTLTCVSNQVGGDLAGNAQWQGVRITDLLTRAKPQAGADCVYSTSADGFTVTTPLAVLTDGRDAMLAIGMNGQPLPIEHGFPVRMVVPGLYGYVSATKWVVDLELTKFSEVTAYWTDRGWAPKGPIKTASRIDVPKSGTVLSAGTAPVAGVAWAQHRGISKVEIQVDDGPWQPAQLSGTVSADTWRQWVYAWPATSGSHLLRVRATDGTGALQTAEVQDVIPDGATGYHTIEVKVT